MFSMPSGTEWLFLLLIVLIVFGAGKLPQVGKSLGTAINEFKASLKSKEETEKKPNDSDSSSSASSQ